MTLREDKTRTSWGRVVREPCYGSAVRFVDEIEPLLAEARARGHSSLAVGLGRSYGDSALNPWNAVIDTTGLDRLISFNPATGLVRAEAGMSLDALICFLVPRGFFLPTSPGTRFVTLAGAVANDVHGKNHIGAGSFGRHVTRVSLIRSDGVLEVARDSSPDLFSATIGGLGLTGIITDVEFRAVPIASAWIDQRITPLRDLDDFFAVSDETDAEHTAAWIDCTANGAVGHGVFIAGDWSKNGGLTPHSTGSLASVPLDVPQFALNRYSLTAFNSLYRSLQLMRGERSRVHYAPHLYPLDSIGGWNRLYGIKGFFQYQCVIDRDAGPAAVRSMLERIGASGEGSCLAVLKMLGNLPSPGMLSFPKPGVTLALDFSNRGEKTLKLLSDLDSIVVEARGRLYPAKDGRMSAEMFKLGYANWTSFAAHVDPALGSSFWRRVSA